MGATLKISFFSNNSVSYRPGHFPNNYILSDAHFFFLKLNIVINPLLTYLEWNVNIFSTKKKYTPSFFLLHYSRGGGKRATKWLITPDMTISYGDHNHPPPPPQPKCCHSRKIKIKTNNNEVYVEESKRRKKNNYQPDRKILFWISLLWNRLKKVKQKKIVWKEGDKKSGSHFTK